MRRTKDYRIHQRIRHINKRLRQIREMFTLTHGTMQVHSDVHDCYGIAPASWRKPGYYDKQKAIDCSCWMCEEHYERHKDKFHYEED